MAKRMRLEYTVVGYNEMGKVCQKVVEAPSQFHARLLAEKRGMMPVTVYNNNHLVYYTPIRSSSYLDKVN